MRVPADSAETIEVDAETSPPIEPLDELGYRHILKQFATGVTVVTMLDGGGRLAGFTANAFSSVSLNPPLVLICVNYRARSYAHLLDSQIFTIHILNGDQTGIAERFAEPGADKSMICPWFVNEREFPILSQYRAALECRLFREYEGGDHAIIVGKVERLHAIASEIEPLISYDGQLFPLGREDDEHGGTLHNRDAGSPHAQSSSTAE